MSTQNLLTNVQNSVIQDIWEAEKTQMCISWQMDKMYSIQSMNYLVFRNKVNEVLIHLMILMNLRNIILSERSQTQNLTYCVTPCIWNVQKKEIHWDKKLINGCLRLVGKSGEWLQKNTNRAFFCSDEMLWNWIVVMMTQICNFTKNHLL